MIFTYDSFINCEVRNPSVFPMSETSQELKNELLNHLKVPKHPETQFSCLYNGDSADLLGYLEGLNWSVS